MKLNKELNNIFGECLKRLSSGETVEACLKSYPGDTSELEPLLRTALVVGHATSAIKPREEFRARARYQFKAALGEAGKRAERPFFTRLPQWVTVLSVILVLLLAGGGTVAASGNSMPDNPLYPVKLLTEQVRLTIPASTLSRAEMEAEFVDSRVTEIIYMANKGNAKQVAALTRRLEGRLTTLVALSESASEARRQEAGGSDQPALIATPAPAPAPPALGAAKEESKARVTSNGQAKLKRTITTYAAKHPAVLKDALEKAPESVRAEVANAIAVAEAGYKKVLKSLD